MRLRHVAALIVVAASAATGLCEDLSFPLRNGERVDGFHDWTDGAHRYDVTCPAGAVLTVRATSDAGTLIALFAPDGGVLADVSRTGRRPLRIRCATSGVYQVVVDPKFTEWIPGPDYSVEVRWTSPRRFRSPPLPYDARRTGSFRFSADAGAVVACSVRSSEAYPRLDFVVAPDGSTIPFPNAGSLSEGTIVAPSTGEYVMRFSDYSPYEGAVVADVRVRPPKRVGRRVVWSRSLFRSRFRPGMDVVVSQDVGPEGGTVAVSSGPAAGAGADVPAGEFSKRRTLFAGSADPITVYDASIAAIGPAVVVGMDADSSSSLQQVRVVVPFDPTRLVGTPVVCMTYRPPYSIYDYYDTPEILEVGADAVTVRPRFLGTFQVFGAVGDAHAQKIVPSDATAGGLFGGSTSRTGAPVAAAGDVFAVGAPADDTAGSGAGSVRVFTRADDGSVAATQKLVAPDARADDGFGFAVAFSRTGDTLVVGTAAGEAVYVYSRADAGWTLQARLDSPRPRFGQGFGRAVAVDVDTLVVGAENFEYYPDEESESLAGNAWVFVREFVDGDATWTMQASLQPTGGGGHTGRSVAVSGNTILCGAPGMGLAMIYDRKGTAWTWIDLLRPLQRSGVTDFGSVVALDGDAALVVSRIGNVWGLVHSFRRGAGTWREEQSPQCANQWQSGRGIPMSVALAGDVAVVGCPWRLDGTYEAGAAFVFRREACGWTQRAKLTATAPAAGDLFGFGVAISGGRVVVTCPGDSDAGHDAGAAYSYDVSGL